MVRIKFILLGLVFLLSTNVNGQFKLVSSAQSTGGQLLNSKSFNSNSIIGQSSSIGNSKSTIYDIYPGYLRNISHLFRSLLLLTPNGSEILKAQNDHLNVR